jgi:hypothetical protein
MSFCFFSIALELLFDCYSVEIWFFFGHCLIVVRMMVSYSAGLIPLQKYTVGTHTTKQLEKWNYRFEYSETSPSGYWGNSLSKHFAIFGRVHG